MEAPLMKLVVSLFCTAILATRTLPQKPSANEPIAPTVVRQELFDEVRNITVTVLWLPEPSPAGQPAVHGGVPMPVGSAVWIGQTGYLATCHHVIEHAGSYMIGVPSDTYVSQNVSMQGATASVDVTIVASDPDTDVAILKSAIPPGQVHPLSAERLVRTDVPQTPLLPTKPLVPKGADLNTDVPQLGQTLLLAGFPLGENMLIVQTGPATGFSCRRSRPTSRPSTCPRIMLSLVSNPGNSGGPVLDANGKVIGLLEGNLPSPVRNEKGQQVLAPRVKLDDSGNPVRDTQGNVQFEIAPLEQNSGISFAVPTKFIDELAKKEKINFQ
jgi:S1-C subfamily serine protease